MKAVQLLLQAANLYHTQRESFSKTEILKRINQIKYLSKKKGSSKFDIRKEIVKLENQMSSIFELEKKIASRRKQESVKVASLKRQLTIAKKRLAASENKDITKKVDKLSHLLGDFLAKHGTTEDIGLTMNAMRELNISLPRHKGIQRALHKQFSHSPNKLAYIQQRLQLLKNELELKKQAEKNPKVISVLEKQIEMIDKKVQAYASAPHIATEISVDMPKPANERHILNFEATKKETIEDLPPLPQPKYR